MYPPPASGRWDPSSAYTSAPIKAMTPPSTHASKVSFTDPTRCATIAGLRKMPDPIMPPTTIIVPENTPNVGVYPDVGDPLRGGLLRSGIPSGTAGSLVRGGHTR